MEKVFELDKVLEQISSHLHTYAGYSYLKTLQYTTSIDEIKENYALLKHFTNLVIEHPPPFDFPELKGLREILIEKGVYELKFLLKIKSFIKGLFKMKEYIEKSQALRERFFKRVNELYTLQHYLQNTFDEDGEVKDSASFRLKEIRNEKRKVLSKIFKKMDEVKEQLEKKGILNDREMRIRNGRFVLLVNASFSPDSGFVLGFSRKKESLYFEPGEVVYLQNELVKLEDEEREEIFQIRKRLSSAIWEKIPLLEKSYRELGEIDFINAKRIFADDIKGCEPLYSKKKNYILKNVYHPILYLKQPETVKGYNFELPGETNVFLISGPNGGGKTVFLKSIGLLTRMIQLSIPVPCSPVSHFYIPSKIFWTGFEMQGSIENGESNFTGFLKELKEILEKADEDSLLIVDEFMGNTDPDQGTGLGFAILEELSRKKVKTFCVSHIGPLKALVEKENKEDMKNAGFGFDSVTKIPTFQMKIGSFEESFAIATAERIGFPENIILRAKSLCKDMLNLLKEIKQSILRKKEEFENWIASRKKEQEEWEMKRKKELLRSLDNAEKEIKEVLKNLKRNKNKKEIQKSLEEIEKKKMEIKGERAKELIIGKLYKIIGCGSLEGELLEKKRDSVLLRIGNMNVWVPKNNLLKTDSKEPVKEENKSLLSKGIPMKSYELHIRKMTREETKNAVEKFLSDAFSSGVKSVRIVHGVGEGVLKSYLWEFLKKDRRVENFYHPPYYEGGYGVTVVDFKE